MDTVNTHGRIAAPRFFVIPKLDALEGAFAEEVDDVGLAPWRDPIADYQFLRGAILEVNNEAVKKNSLTADPQLNRAKVNTTTGDLNPAMILTAVDLRIAQEVPKLTPGEYGGGKGKGQEPSDSIAKALANHL